MFIYIWLECECMDLSDIITLIPIKSFSMAKTRLKNSLTPTERSILVAKMFQHVLNSVKKCTAFGVVSPSSEILQFALEQNAQFTYRDQADELNLSLNNAINTLWSESNSTWQAIFILMADLPFITSKELKRILNNFKDYSVGLLPADKENKQIIGTSGLFITKKIWKNLVLTFGYNSLNKFITQFSEQNIDYLVQRSLIGFDIDTNDDLIFLKNQYTFFSTELEPALLNILPKNP